MKILTRILAVVAALVAVLGLSTVPANAAKATVLRFNTAAPSLGYTAGAVYVPGVTSNHGGAPIVITVSGDCAVSGPDAGGSYTVTYGNGNGVCTITATQAAGAATAPGSRPSPGTSSTDGEGGRVMPRIVTVGTVTTAPTIQFVEVHFK